MIVIRSFSASFLTFSSVAFKAIFVYISCIFLMKYLVGDLLLSYPSAKSQSLAKNLDETKRNDSSEGDDYGKIFFCLFNAGRSIDKLERSFSELKVTIRSC